MLSGGITRHTSSLDAAISPRMKLLFFAAIFVLLLSTPAFALNVSGYATIVGSASGTAGYSDWALDDNILGGPNGQSTYNTFSGVNGPYIYTEAIHARHYNTVIDQIPACSRIDGIEVTVYKSNPFASTSSVRDSSVWLQKTLQDGPAFPGTSFKQNISPWPAVNTPVTYGGPNDTWGKPDWTVPIDLQGNNEGNFGVKIRAEKVSGSPQALLDAVQIRFYYTPITSFISPNITSTPIYPNTPNITCVNPNNWGVETAGGSVSEGEYRFIWQQRNSAGNWVGIDSNAAGNTLFNSLLGTPPDPSYDFNLGQAFRCKMTIECGAETDYYSSVVTVIGRPPSVPAPLATLVPSPNAFRNQQINVSNTPTSTAFDGGSAPTVYYVFYSSANPNAPLQNSTSKTYSNCQSNPLCVKGVNISVKTYATNNLGTSALSNSSNNVTIVNSPPPVPNVPTLTPPNGNKTTFFLASTNLPVDIDGDAVTIQWRWFNLTDIMFDNSSVNPLNCQTTAGCKIGGFILVAARACDGTACSAYSAYSIPARVGGLPPTTPSTPAISPLVAYRNTQINSTIVTSSDPEGLETPMMSYIWYVNGVARQNSTNRSFTCSSYNSPWQCTKGMSVLVRAQANDSDGWSNLSAASNAIVIQNSPPTIPNVPTLSSNTTPATVLSRLTSTAGTGSTDIDPGDSVKYSYRWFNGTNIILDNSSNQSIVCGQLIGCRAGSQMRVAIKADDNTDSSNYSAYSNIIVIGGSPPSTPDQPTIAPPFAYKADTLTSSTGKNSLDPDGDAITYKYRWMNNTAIIADNTSSNSLLCLTASGCRKGQTIVVAVKAETVDGNSSYSPFSNPGTLILNTPPTTPSKPNLTANPSPATINSILNSSAGAGSTDIDGDSPLTYQYRWFNGSAILLDNSPSQSVLCSGLPGCRKGSQMQVATRAFDGTNYSNYSAYSDVLLIGGGAPSTPNTPSISPLVAFKTTLFTSTNGTGSTDPDGDAVAYYYRWTITNVFAPFIQENASNQMFCLIQPNCIKNFFVSVSIRAESIDGNSSYSAASNAVFVQNTPPVTGTPTLSPIPAFKNTPQINCSNASSFDIDGDPVSYLYLWYRNNSSTGIATPSIGNSSYNRGDTLICQITPFDGQNNGQPKNSSPLTITGNGAPSTAIPILSPIPAYKTTPAITCTNASTSDPEGDAVNFTYRWYRNASVVNGVARNLTNAFYNRGDRIICQITPFDGQDSGASVNSSALTISNSRPNTTNPSISPQPVWTDTSPVFCLNGNSSDADGDAVGYAYRWYVNGNFSGLISQNISNAAFGAGDSLICEIWPWDGFEFGDPKNSTAAIVQMVTPPTVGSVFILPNPAYKKLPVPQLSCNYSNITAPSGYNLSAEYVWFNNGSAVDGNSQNLTNAYYTKHDLIVCQVTPVAQGLRGIPLNSSALEIRNTPPNTTPPTFNPSSAVPSTPLITCVPSTTFDDDDDAVSFTYRWYKNGTYMGITANSIGNVNYGESDRLTCEITPRDNEVAGLPKNSTITILFAIPPETAEPTIAPNPAYVNTPLSCNNGTTTGPANYAITFTYRWFKNTVELVGATGKILSTGNFVKGDSMVCEITPCAGGVCGEEKTSQPRIISNSPPSISRAYISPKPAYYPNTTSLSCLTEGAYDADGDHPIVINYAWFRDGSPTGVTASTIASSYYATGVTMRCVATPTDGFDNGIPRFDEVTIGAEPPPPPPPSGSLDLWLCLPLILMIVVLLVALAYMASKAIDNPMLDAWVKIELQEIFATVLIAVLCLGIIVTADAAAQWATGESGNVITISRDWLQQTVFEDGRAIYTKLSEAYFNAAKVASYSYTAGVSIAIVSASISESPGSGLSPLVAELGKAMDNVSNFMLLAVAQNSFLKFFGTAFGVMFPTALALRAFAPTRKIGGTLLAAVIAASVIYPASFMLSREVYKTYRTEMLSSLNAQWAAPAGDPPSSELVCNPFMQRFVAGPIPGLGGELGWQVAICLPICAIPGVGQAVCTACYKIIEVFFYLTKSAFPIITYYGVFMPFAGQLSSGSLVSGYYTPLATYALPAVAKYTVLSLLVFLIPVIVAMVLLRNLAITFGGEPQLYGISKLV